MNSVHDAHGVIFDFCTPLPPGAHCRRDVLVAAEQARALLVAQAENPLLDTDTNHPLAWAYGPLVAALTRFITVAEQELARTEQPPANGPQESAWTQLNRFVAWRDVLNGKVEVPA